MTYNLNTKDYVQEAINLKTYPLNDNDKILLAYSKDKGLIRLVAKGVKKQKANLPLM
ncbi:MAG: recombination protein O N-terminal domain-containing protein [Candidatus Melainabacteria bacterium]|nr:MAG: recombination protein O N-terminal domain-containing protein [Candidatus Melainabacteria bacterium]